MGDEFDEFGYRMVNKKVKLAIIRQDKDTDMTETHAIRMEIPHPDWNWDSGEGDVGLIWLKEPSKISPAKINRSKPYPDKTLKVMGWGRFKKGSEAMANRLRIADADVITMNKCQKLPTGSADLIENHICTLTPKKSFCSGDSGGPLFDPKNPQTVYGVVSQSAACGGSKYPDLYMNIAPFVAWIDQTIADLQTGVYRPWDQGQPTPSPDKACLEMTDQGRWRYADCNESKPYLCAKQTEDGYYSRLSEANGMGATPQCAEGYSFAHPLQPREMDKFRERMQENGIASIWIKIPFDQ
jgi:hypothetical protein